MKKAILSLFASIALLSMPVMAAEPGNVSLVESPKTIVINGTTFSPVDTNGVKIPVVEINGILYVPFDTYNYALGQAFTFDKITNKVTVGAASAANNAPTPAPAVPSNGTIGQINALKKAQSYLSHTAFSYSGLISQLEYEKFSHDDAVYAVDNCGADWNQQAAKKAASYLSHTAFSKDSLIDQLEYEGFTYEQAVYGAQANGY